MLDFLEKCEINNDVINEMKSNNVSANLYNLSCNSDEVIKIVQYLNKIGVNCVNELLIYRINIFFLDFETFIEKFVKNDIDNFVKIINTDYNLVDEI